MSVRLETLVRKRLSGISKKAKGNSSRTFRQSLHGKGSRYIIRTSGNQPCNPSFYTEIYCRRNRGEENFLDDKSIGFKFESSEIRNAEAHPHLALILATRAL